MSRNNLLLSLLANNPNSRSNSHAKTHELSPSMSFYPRSTSNSLKKLQKTSAHKMKDSSQLFKLLHLLNIKVKQNYYFTFCKLQQLYKTKAPIKSHTCQNNTQIVMDYESSIKKQQQIVQKTSQHQKKQLRKAYLNEGLTKLCDIHMLLITKIKVRQEKIQLKASFKAISDISFKNLSLQKIQTILNNKKKQLYKQFFDNHSYLQHAKMRVQIMITSLTQLAKKIMVSYFGCIKSYQPNLKYQQDSFTYSQKNYQRRTQVGFQTTFSDNSLMNDLMKQQSYQLNTDKTNRSIKIKIKQKNTTATKPIKLQQIARLAKPLKISFNQPLKVELPQQACQNTIENKSVLINLHHEHLSNPLPDFTDNCNIFTILPEALKISLDKININQAVQVLQPRKSRQMLPTEDGSLTDRTKFQEPLSQSTFSKAVHSANNSLGKGKPKKVLTFDHSPLKKVQQLFKSVQQFHSVSAANKQKKLININLPKFFNNENEKINNSKTPLKQLREQIHISNSKGKQNKTTRQRLLTERDKQKLDKGGLQQSGAKYKSSMLVRQKKGKPDKLQLSTARKMKMEIENIISRRNKQLSMRNELYQLK